MKRLLPGLLLLLVHVSSQAATPWAYTMTFRNPCQSKSLNYCKYQFRYTVDGAWSTQYSIQGPGRQAGELQGTDEAFLSSTRQGEGIWFRGFGQTNYGGEVLYTDIGYVSSNSPNALVTFILECSQAPSMKHARVCVFNQDSVARQFQVYVDNQPMIVCHGGQKTWVEVQPGQRGCIDVHTDNINGVTLQQMGAGTSVAHAWPEECPNGGTETFLIGDNRTTVAVPWVWANVPPAEEQSANYRGETPGTYDPGTNGTSPIVWSAETNGTPAQDASVKLAAQAAFDQAAKASVQAHDDSVKLLSALGTNTGAISAGVGTLSNAMAGAAGSVTNAIAGAKAGAETNAALISNSVSNSAGALGQLIASNLTAGFYGLQTGLLAGIHGLSSNLTGLGALTNEHLASTNEISAYDLTGLGTNYESAAYVRDNSGGYSSGQSQLESMDSWLGSPVGAEFSGSAWTCDVSGFQVKVDMEGGPFGQVLGFCRKVATWFLLAAYLTLLFKDSWKFVQLGGTARGTKVPNLQMEMFGTGGNFIGAGLAPVKVALLLVGYGALLAALPVAAQAMFHGTGASLSSNPFSGYSSDLSRGIHWLSLALPLNLIISTTVAYAVWRLSMLKAGTAFIGLVRTTPD